jgi:tRNA U38,U39,U40 pseudouridine synthase TruA
MEMIQALVDATRSQIPPNQLAQAAKQNPRQIEMEARQCLLLLKCNHSENSFLFKK